VCRERTATHILGQGQFDDFCPGGTRTGSVRQLRRSGIRLGGSSAAARRASSAAARRASSAAASGGCFSLGFWLGLRFRFRFGFWLRLGLRLGFGFWLGLRFGLRLRLRL
jgi:uncharacterized membrane protein